MKIKNFDKQEVYEYRKSKKDNVKRNKKFKEEFDDLAFRKDKKTEHYSRFIPREEY